MTRQQHLRWSAPLLLIAAECMLSACGNSSKQHSQVVARVNDQDVTMLQLNQALQSTGAESATPEAVHAALDSLIDEELLVQQAMKVQLHRDPTIVQELDQARRRLLAQAYAQRMLYPKIPISLTEEEKYYRDNPALFENRKLYRLTAFTVQNSDLNDRLNADLDAARSVDEVRDVLEKHEVKFETQQLNSAAEELPLDKLDQFAKAKVGDLLIGGQRDGKTLLMSLVAVEARPITFEHAKPLIEQYLTTVRNAQATEAYLKRAKESAKISYSARFSESAPRSALQPDTKAPAADGSVSIASSHTQDGVTGLN
jgi:peptidyl-prolyl cis-trans isomerase C